MGPSRTEAVCGIQVSRTKAESICVRNNGGVLSVYWFISVSAGKTKKKLWTELDQTFPVQSLSDEKRFWATLTGEGPMGQILEPNIAAYHLMSSHQSS